MSNPDDGPFGERTWLARMESGVLWWERMRLVYNAVVGMAGIALISLMGGWEALTDEETWYGVIGSAIFCNLAYFLGPLVDVYGHVITRGRLEFKDLRVVLFILGTVLTLLVMLMIGTVAEFDEVAVAD